MKIAICIIIVLISCLVGISISESYKQKITFFEEFESFLQYLDMKIAFFQDDFCKCVHLFIETNKPKSDFFEKLYKQSKVGQIDKKFLLSALTCLDKSTGGAVADIVCAITNMNVEDSKRAIAAGVSYSKDKIETSKLIYQTKGQVYLKICICVGLLVCILIY